MADASDAMLRLNGLLAALSVADRVLISPLLRQQALPLRSTLQLPFRKISYVYFLQRGIASVIALSKHERRQAEVGLIGHEGMTGVAAVLGVDRSPCSILMQVAGEGLRISAGDLQSVMAQSQTLRQGLTRFVHVLTVQTEYTALANADGTIHERLARWLLMIHDRTQGDEMKLTHELIGRMLDTQRSGITLALKTLSHRGLIKMARGSVTILDRAGLETAAGDLYGVPEAEYKRLIG